MSGPLQPPEGFAPSNQRIPPAPPGFAPPMPPGFKAPPTPPGFKAPPMPPGFKAPPMPPGFVPPMPPGFKAPPMPPGFKAPPMPPCTHEGAGVPLMAPTPPGRSAPMCNPQSYMAPRYPGPGMDQEKMQMYRMPPGAMWPPNDPYGAREGPHHPPPPGGEHHQGYVMPQPPSYSHTPYGSGPVVCYNADRRAGFSSRDRREDEMREPTNTVWVGNLDPYIHTEDYLQEVFREFGRVIRVAKVPDKSYCFVHFRYVEEARIAVETLTVRGSLTGVRFNYGKMFEYGQEDGHVPEDLSGCGTQQRPHRRGREDERYEHDERRRRPRREEEPMEPTNVLWLGDVPPSISNEELNENFKVFGTINSISRLASKNMAFIHFETIESCTQALDLMRDQPIAGVRLSLNYGRAQRHPQTSAAGLTPDGIPLSETPTNVVYIGQLASDVVEEDVEDMFEPFEGFISSKFIQSSGIAFAHFDSVEHARIARVALNNAHLKGSPIRISFGKNSHTMTMADRVRRGRPAPLGISADGGGNVGSGAVTMFDGVNGALVAGPGVSGQGDSGAIVSLPAMGVTVGTVSGPAPASYFTRERPVPEITLDARLQSLLGASYNSCGEPEKSLSPSVIQTICDLIDECVDEKTEKRLDDTIFLYTPLNSAHVFGILAKRMHDHFNDDPHKKLLILYAATRVLLGAKTDYLMFTKQALNAYLMTLFVASEGQTAGGMEVLTSIIENVQRHPFVERQRLDVDFPEVFRGQLEEINKRVKEEQDLASLMTKKMRK
ncbi:putative RNA-binding protein [Trypanosoma vivax]|nr:putative RNA-binding protein [Trypanosoma vivax]